MKAAIFRKHGGPEVIEMDKVPRPELPAGHVMVSVRAAAMNHLDLWARRGLPGLELDFPHIGGADVAGVIDAIGAGVGGIEVGARVLVNPGLWCTDCEWCEKGEESLCTSYRLLGEHVDGGFAEYVAVPVRNVLPIPDDLTFEHAAAVPLVFQTAWRALMHRGRLMPGETVLVTGGSGGVSTAAVQIAKLAGAYVFAVTSGPEKVRRLEELGADVVIDRLEADFSKEIWQVTEKRGVDLILDSVGEDIFQDLTRTLARDGRLVAYGATTGPHGQINIRLAFWRQLQIVGTTMSNQEQFIETMSLVFQKVLEPVIDVVWPLEKAREAHERLEAGDGFGKIVLTP
jgi:NADPH:quinone reductase-like Zn-dependent oxidoreductase